MNDSNERFFHEQWRIEWNFVDVVDDHIIVIRSAILSIEKRNDKVEKISMSSTNNFYAIDIFFTRQAFMRTAKQGNLVSHLDDSFEDLMEMNFCTAAQWIPNILPINYQYFITHSFP